MKRVEIIRGVVLGPGKHATVGEVHDVEDRFARILIHNRQARVAPAPAAPAEGKKNKKDGAE